jgi:hypothetical protein
VPDVILWGGDARAPTDGETKFAGTLLTLMPGLDLWLHADDDGTPWLCVSRDFVVDRTVCDTLRLDFDAAGIRGGWSPASLNWDGGIRAEAAGIDLRTPEGIDRSLGNQTPQHLAMIAAKWFGRHVDLWPGSARGRRRAKK